MYKIDSFVANCQTARAERSKDAIRDVARCAVARPDAILKVLGEPSGANAGARARRHQAVTNPLGKLPLALHVYDGAP